MLESTHKNISLETLNRIAGIDEFKGRWESLGQLVPNRLRALQRIANIESTAAITRMKGIRCSDRQIGELLNGLQPAKHLSLEKQGYINGFHRVLKLVNDSYDQIPLIESHILQMHSLLVNKDESTVTGTPGLHSKLLHLIEHVNDLITERRLHPLLILSDFSCRFWHLRPFQQGNNRLTWLLTQLLLLRHDYNFLPYGSLEKYLEKRLSDYQKTLLFDKDGEIVIFDPQAWLALFLDAMTGLQENITAKIFREKKMLKLSAANLEIIRIIQENGQSTISQIMLTTNTNRNTLKVRLRKLVAEKYLVQRGRGKSTNYILPELHLP